MGPDGSPRSDPRRSLPRVDSLLDHPLLARCAQVWGHDQVRREARRVLAAARDTTAPAGAAPSCDTLAAQVAHELDSREARRVRPVINATGVILHTNLGRAPLSAASTAAVAAAAGYSTVEYDLLTGGRGRRGAAVEWLLREVTGLPAALAVNNGAAALLLALAALARGREVVVSRGELIEIGGEFRLPGIMQAAGVTLVEVGTTNRTHLTDYLGAVGDQTALVLVVHQSNFRVQGFTARPPLADLVTACHERALPVLHDIGSGLLDEAIGDEPTLAASGAANADLVMFSGDKLLGGPQAGIVAGRADLIARLSRHPIARAVRIDKLTAAALEATLMAHLTGRREELPVWRALRLTEADLRPRAKELARLLGPSASVREGTSMVGGGCLPGQGLPSPLLLIDPAPVSEAAALLRLRATIPPVIARAERGKLVVDLRTVPPEQDGALAAALRVATGTGKAHVP